MHIEGGAHTRWSVATAGVMLFKGPQARRYTQKAVHTQGGTHKRRSVATAGVMLFKGPQARWCTRKAVHTQGRGGRGGGRGGKGARGGVVKKVGGGGVGSYTQKAVHTQGGADTRQCTHKAVCGHRRSHVI